MRNLKPTLVIGVASGILLFTGCGNMVPQLPGEGGGDHYIYNGHDFGPNRDADYRAGVVDGCSTSDGNYRKNHSLFRTNESYRAGWEHGRLHCKGTPTS